MPGRIWLRCDRSDVDRMRCTLKINGKLEKKLKIKTGTTEHERIIPTILQFDHGAQDDTHEKEILKSLGLADVIAEDLASIRWLPLSDEKRNSATEKAQSIEEVIQTWLEALPATIFAGNETQKVALILSSPKRWTIYEPMVLLPPGTFQDTIWTTLLQDLDQPTKALLWARILQVISCKTGKKPLTHLAINAGIPSTQDHPAVADPEDKNQNVLRSPSHLVLLHGDFGPAPAPGIGSATKDFDDAFWVSTRQNGIFQTWAPRYTMFSRGNIKEKARILTFHDNSSSSSNPSGPNKEDQSATAAVDLYSGIGYFAFSYAALGINCVLCWELNPWSLEGLRRGAAMNGWSARIVRGRELEMSMEEILRSRPRLLVFEESNESAVERIRQLRAYEASEKERLLGEVIHVNCGFLPSSRSSWLGAWEIVSNRRRAWLHLHENVGWDELEDRKREIASFLERLPRASVDVHLQHMELVKTFAPDVWHCVFDVSIVPAPADAP